MAQAYDVVIVGGGAAGLSAALVLGRCRRTVLVCDDGHPCNGASLAAHCLLGNEGIAPSKLLAKGRQELTEYEGVVFRDDHVHSITKGNQNEFTVLCEKGLTATARKVLLTTGLKDQVPKIDGIEGLYGRSVHQCLYCDGFENRDKPIGVYGKGDKGAGLALMMRQWSADIILCTDGPTTVSQGIQASLKQHGIEVCRDQIVKLEGDDKGCLQHICFADGSVLKRTALFFSTGCVQRSDLWERLGCKRDEKGGIISHPITEESSVPGVYVAGDASVMFC